jgi:hypothetical protein
MAELTRQSPTHCSWDAFPWKYVAWLDSWRHHGHGCGQGNCHVGPPLYAPQTREGPEARG